MILRFKRLIACGLALAATALGSTAFGDVATTTAAVQNRLDAVYPGQGWKALSVDEVNANNIITKQTGNTILTLPAGSSYATSSPAVLSNRVAVSSANNRLHVKISSHTVSSVNYDWIFSVKVNGAVVYGPMTIRCTTAQDHWIPLDRWIGQTVSIELLNAPGGVIPNASNGTWCWELARWELIEFVDTTVLTQDEDWTEQEATKLTGMIDLNGHNLTVSTLPNICTITDSSAAGDSGELHVNVAPGTTVENTSVTLSGTLKLVKDGDGAFTATKTGQTYAGGTEVAGGQFNVPSGSESANKRLGAAGTAVAVGAGATLELNGNTTFNVHPLVLAGGTVQNSSATEAKLGDITLTADSLLKTPYAGQYGDFGIASGSTIDLGGFKLTVDFLQKKNKQLVIYGPGVQMKNGTIRLQNSGSGWGCLWLKGGDIDAPTVNFEVADAQFNVVSNLSIGDFIAEGGSTVENHAGGGKLKVYGRFQPWTDFFFGCELQTGAVLDLSRQSGVWNSTSRVKTISVKPPRTVTFASGATITIDVGARELAKGDQVVAWSAIPANVLFRIVGTEILADEQPQVTAAGIFYTADPDAIMTATWTGEAGDGNVATPGNWACTNALGRTVQDALPGEKTTVTFVGGNLPDITTGSTLTAARVVLFGAMLADDRDWRGLSATIPVSGTIDLNGHNLTVSQLAGDCEISDSSATTVYERLEYIESTGQQHIDTKYKLLANDIVDARVYVPNPQPNTANGIAMLFGCSPSSGANYYFRVRNGSYVLRYKRGSKTGDSDASASTGFYNAIVDVHSAGNTLTWTTDKSTGTLTATGATLSDCGINCHIFNENENNSTTYYRVAARLYSFKITSGGTVVRDFVPVRRSDGVLGLLDLEHLGSTDAANPEFYANAGMGAFTAGAVTGSIGGGELHVNVASGTVTGSAKLTGSVTLVKDGEGTFKWNGGANSVATTCPVVITNGVFGFATDADNVFGNSGTITIAGKGQMDVSKKSSNGDNTYSPVYNRTLYIEGDGPDGSGAITRSVTSGGWGYHLKVVNLTGGATIGGKSRVDFRGTGFKLNGAGHTLTVKNKALCVEDSNQGPITVGRIVVTDGGKFEPCAGSGLASLQIAECIELTNGGKLMPWHRTSSSAYSLGVPVTVGAGGGTIGTDQGKLSITKPVTVLSGSTATVSQTVTFKDVEVQGTLNATGTADITGTLSGGGTVSGANAKFSGDATRWTMAANAGGWTSKADLAGASTTALAALKAIDITYADTASPEGQLEIAPALGLTAETLPALTVKTEDGNEIASFLTIKDDKLYVTIDLDAVVTATWTGAGEDGKLDDPANWACTNALGGAVVGRLPIEQTTVTFVGDKVPSIQTESPFAAKAVVLSGAELSADCDWSGLTVPVSGVIDLKGNKLTVSQLAGDCEITDTSAAGAGGELHVNVASGAAVNNTTVTLTGSLKLVKEGAGAFTATKTGQTYAGGTEVAGGQFNVPSGSESENKCLGAAGTAVAVGAGATLELNGNTTFNVHPLVLAGGTVQNSTSTEAKLGDITLTADSLLKTPYAGQYGDFGIASGSRIDLGGFKLTVDFQKKANKQLVIYGPGVQMKNGTIRLQNSGSGWGCLWLKGGDIDAPTVSFEVADAQFNVVSNLSIGDFIAEGGDTVENHAGGGKLKVYGRFQPWTDFFFGCELQTGAVLDLSRQSGVWNSTSRVKTSKVNTPRTVTFASGATITIDLGARTDAGDHGKIVSWTAAPANVTFRLADGIRGRLVVTSEGIFLRRGLMLIVR